jgi:alcohol dehydrogenase class IV
MSYSFNLPTKILFGVDELQQLPDILASYGSRILFVCPQEIVAMAQTCINNLKTAGLDVTLLEQDVPEPSCQYIDRITAELKAHRSYNAIVGFGGGSAMDLAKALSISLTHEESIWLYANLSNRPPLPLQQITLPVVTVATTSGTGSEVTPYAVLTNTETCQKGTIQEPAIFPKVAILDASLLVNMPLALTASTAIDAFAHALEATINISKPAPMAELFGIKAMSIIARDLPAVLENLADIELRQNMAYASTLAGMAISHRGTTTTHAIAEPLGALTKIPHAVAVAMTTMPVMVQTVTAAETILSTLDRDVFGAAAGNAADFNRKLANLIRLAGLDKTLTDVLGTGLIDGLEDKLVDNVMRYKFRPLKQHPVEWGEDKIRAIVKDLIGA